MRSPRIMTHGSIALVSLITLGLIACDSASRPSATTPIPPAAPSSSVSINGSYAMTLMASARCTSLPDNVKTRTYDAVIVLDETLLSGTLKVSGAANAAPKFGFSVSGNTLLLDIDNGLACGDDWDEPVPPVGLLYVCGRGHLVADSSTISGPLTGTVGYEAIAGDYTNTKECYAPDHLITLRRNP